MHLDVPIDCTYDQLLAMIYSMMGIDKEKFKLVITCKYSLKRRNMFQPCPIWDNCVYRMLKLINIIGIEEIELYLLIVRVKPQVNQSVGTYTNLLLLGNINVDELDYDYGPSSTPVNVEDRCKVNKDDQGCKDDGGGEDGDDESDGDGHIQADGHVLSFLTINSLMVNEQRRYVSMDAGPALGQGRRGTCPGPPLAQGPLPIMPMILIYNR